VYDKLSTIILFFPFKFIVKNYSRKHAFLPTQNLTKFVSKRNLKRQEMAVQFLFKRKILELFLKETSIAEKINESILNRQKNENRRRRREGRKVSQKD